MISAIVLAAGKSERMGRPKALLPFRGRTFLENILDSIAESSVEHTVVVLGHHRAEVERTVPMPAAVFNEDYEQGMITSLQKGIRALPPAAEGAVIFLVDHPVVEVSTIEALIANFSNKPIVVPVYKGRRGHPVLFGREVLGEILALPHFAGANIVVRKDPGRVLEVPVDAPGVLIDIDTPEQLEELLKEQQ